MWNKNKYFSTIKKEIYEHMLKTRGHKYKWFLRALHSFKYLSLNPTRGEFLESYYTLMRFIDDVVDGDASLPSGFDNSESFVLDKIRFAGQLTNPKDGVDHMMLYCFRTAERFGQDFTSETKDILYSMLFDSKRYGKRVIFQEAELHYHFNLLDVRGTISATLKVFGEDQTKYFLLKPLGLASRIYYNLRDYDEDMYAGLVNISTEDCEKFKITPANLEDRLSIPIQNWMYDQAIQGMKLIKEHRQKMEQGNFGILAKIALLVVYEKPAHKYFEQIIQKAV